MRLRIAGALLAVVTASLAAAAGAKTHWRGTCGGYRWQWTSTDVTAVPTSGRGSFSLKRHLFPGPPSSDDLEGLTFLGVTVQPRSLVGPYLSYREDRYWQGGAHPSGSIGYHVIDVRNPKRAVALTDLFPQAQVRDALWNDPVVRKVLNKEGVRSRPATAAALVAALELKSFGGEEGMTYQFTGDFLRQFAFHHLEGNRVAVRLNVPWGAEIYRFRNTEIGILLPIPERLRIPLARAAAGREGFLFRGVARQFGDRDAVLLEVGRQD